MKDFRIAKCLENGVVKEFVIFTDGSDKREIFTDKKYGKYFRVENEFGTKFIHRYFYDRPYDAYLTILNGNGDVMLTNNGIFSSTSIHVCYFLDRNVGEKLRTEFLNGWSNTKFAYTVKAGNKNSLSGYRYLTEDANILSVFDNQLDYVCFDTEDEANIWIEDIIKKAKSYATRIIEKGSDEIKVVLNELEITSILENFVFDLLNPDGTDWSNDGNLNEFGYSIVQCIVPSKEMVS